MSARVEQVASAELNTWLIGDDDEVIVIGPGHDPVLVLDAVRPDLPQATGPVPLDGAFLDYAGQLNAIGEALLTLPGDTRVLPGQGRETTIAAAVQDFDSWAAAGPQ